MIHQLRLILRPIIFINLLLSVLMVLCGVYGLLNHEREAAVSFFQSTAFAIVLSIIMGMFSKSREKKIITIRSGFVLVVLVWIFTCFIGAVPYYLSGSIPKIVDALFESVSGFTTVGASILTDIESLPSSILLWRALTHWIGGGGIVVLSVAILPLLGIGGTHLMQAETTGVTKEKLTPRITQTAKYIWILYLILNIIGVALLHYGGMNYLDAFTHASSAIATGGFSNKNTSVGYFQSAYIDWIIIGFMYIGSLNFLVLIKALKGNLKSFFYDSEIRVFTLIIIVISTIVSLLLYFEPEGFKDIHGNVHTSLYDAFRFGTFQVVSIISTTGFATADYNIWNPAAQILIFLMFFIGGSSGSTSGGIKVIRHIVMFKQAVINIKSLIHPKGVFTMRINNNPISNKVVITVMGFVIAYFTTLFIGAFIVALSGQLTAFESISAMLGALGTVGPGFGAVGPAGNYGFLPDFAKITLFVSMIIGRLELFTVLILFSPWFWKK